MKSNWSYGPETTKLGFDLCNLDFWDLWPWTFAQTSLVSLVITPENFIMIPWWKQWKRCDRHRQRDRQTDRQTERQTGRQTVIFLKENPFENVICKMLAIFFRPKYEVGEVFPWGGISVIYSVCVSISSVCDPLHENNFWLDFRHNNKFYGAWISPKFQTMVM